jgi:hypothetical protein
MGIGAILAFVERNRDRPIVIGIGEKAHGDEVSWGFRLEIMKRLAASYPTLPVTVQLDFQEEIPSGRVVLYTGWKAPEPRRRG